MITTVMATCLLDFFVSMGLVMGGSLLGGLSALLTHHNPGFAILKLADELKIWALVAALGGTMDPLRVFHRGVFDLNLGPMARQFLYIIAAFIGCHVGYVLLRWLVIGGDSNV